MPADDRKEASQRFVAFLLQAPRWVLLGSSGVLIAAVWGVDLVLGSEISLGVLYVLPVMLASLTLSRPQVIALAAGCMILRAFGLADTGLADMLFRSLLALTAYCSTGLFVLELIRNRRLTLDHLKSLAHQQRLRLELEEQLRALAESSPAGILTLDENACLLSANRAALEMLGLPPGGAAGVPMAEMLPVLASALRLPGVPAQFRTSAQCPGRRADAAPFLAETWFSTYETPAGRRLAAIVVDCSEETREREETNLRQLEQNNRILAAAVSHEVRNVCGAISLVYTRLNQLGAGAGEDFDALGHLVDALQRIASADLHALAQAEPTPVDLAAVLNQLRVVIEPNWQEAGGAIRWDLPGLPLFVLAESYGLMQAFLNLAQNSLRAAVDAGCDPLLTVSAAAGGEAARIAFTDAGPGIENPHKLFQPFQPGAGETGLGLYISRAIIRSFGGELEFEPASGGSRFVIELPLAHSFAGRHS
jgi:signal transduction histidine kinase